MKTEFTKSDMREAYDRGVGVGIHTDKMDVRNDDLSNADRRKYRRLQRQHGNETPETFSGWLRGRFQGTL